MAQTYTYGDVLSMIATSALRSTEDDKAAHIANLALNKIWKRYDWPESVAALPPFALTPGEQDHGAPAVSVPPDFSGLRSATLVELNGIPARRTPIKRIARSLQLTNAQDLPEAISYEPSVDAFRLYPRVPSNISGPTFFIDGVYKKNPTKVTSSTIHSTLLPFDDRYLETWIEVMRWASWTLQGNPQAGGVVMANGQKSFSGQLARAEEAMAAMASDAGLFLGDALVQPDPELWF
jgi:hypothetical protein